MISRQKLQEFIVSQIDNAVKNITATLITSFQIDFDELINENKRLSRQVAELKETIHLQKSFSESNKNTPDDSVQQNKPVNIKNTSEENGKNVAMNKNVQPLPAKILTFAEKLKKGKQENIDQKSENRNNNEHGMQMEQKQNEKEKLKKGKQENIDQKSENRNNNEHGMQMEQKQNENDFITVQPRRKRNSALKTTFGTADGIKLKGAIRYSHLHVYGLHPLTTVSEVEEYLKSKGFNSSKCTQLQSKRPEEYASFKISVPFNSLEDAKNPNIWPSGVSINRFLERLAAKATKIS
ncbi:hypothetical protein QE152_g1847 [Popillia japonica]|uniref:Uncharacterized protein n=1 Tax=Popillia japonica TaxID=7064 RepID=A0AAW1N5D5_POPJA